MNANRALRHNRDTLCPHPGDSEPITDGDPPADGDRCPWALPGTDIQCRNHRHPAQAACTATGVRDGVRFTAFWWRP